MTEIALQAYLRAKDLPSLQQAFSVQARRHGLFPNLVCLKYSQYDSPMEQPIVQQCRGIILDESADWAVVSYPFNKFFNYGEPYAAPIDWDTACVQDKLDGSLMTLYHYAGEWRVQSSGSPDASGEVVDCGFTFGQLLWDVWARLSYQLPNGHEDHCFMFELETPHNRVIVQQEAHSLVLHGVRNLCTFEESSPSEWAEKMGWAGIKSYPFGSIEALINQAEALDPFAQEGFVVCDRHFNRIKLKSSEYVKIAHIKEGSSFRKLLSIIVNNESSEFLSYFQELADLFDEIQAQYDALVKKLEAEYDKYKNIEGQKDFAMAVKALPYSGVLFALRAGKVNSVRDYLAGLPVVKVEQFLETLGNQST